MISNIISALSLIVSISLAILYFIDRKHHKFILENDYTNQLLDWHHKTIDVLKKLAIKNRNRDSFEYKEDLSALSSQIEQGRFFFPNITSGNSHGSEKPTAYRGYRNLALDFLVSSYNLYCNKETQKSIDDADKLQRYFTSIVFEIVNPKERLSKIQTLTDRYFIQEKSYEDFINTNDSSAIKYIWRQE